MTTGTEGRQQRQQERPNEGGASFALKTRPWGAMLSAIIITTRAFQPGAAPVEQWSGWSWVWMTMPYWSSAFFGTVGVLLWGALAAWASARRY